MELSKNLQSLIERAESLHDRLSDEIKNSISFCRFYLENGRFCDTLETPFEERGRLTAITESLKEVEDMLEYLQRLRSWQLIDRHVTLNRMEESRLVLIDKVTQHPGRALDVVQELKACFGNKNAAFNWNLQKRMKKMAESDVHKRKWRITGFLSSVVRNLIKPWKWQEVFGIAVKLILGSVSISSAIHFYQTRREYCCSSKRKILSKAAKSDSLLSISKSPLDVFYGRG